MKDKKKKKKKNKKRHEFIPVVPAPSPAEEATAILQPPTEHMETHAHHLHKAPGKGWKHLAFEFLMLFLAVFAGFLAENQREEWVEHGREKKFMNTLLADLANDTANFSQSAQVFRGIADRFDSSRAAVKNPDSKEKLLAAYETALVTQRFSSFNYSDRTIEQLRSAGNFRIIHHEKVSDLLIEYDRYIRHTYMGLEKILEQQSLQLQTIQNEIFDFDVLNEMMGSNYRARTNFTADSLHAPLKLNTDNRSLILKYYNGLGIYRNFCLRMARHSESAKTKAKELMNLVRKEYHLRD